MFKINLLIIGILLTSHLALARNPSNLQAATTIKNTADLAKVLNTNFATNIPFDITATVISPVKNPKLTFAAEDPTGRLLFKRDHSCNTTEITQGDLIRIKGITKVDLRVNLLFAAITNINIIHHTPPQPPVEITWDDIRKGGSHLRLVKARGIVRDAFRDEIDQRWDYIQLQNEKDSIFVCVFADEKKDCNLQDLIGAEVDTVGIYMPHRGLRRMIGNTIYVAGWDDLTVTKPAHNNIFNVPSLNDIPQSALPNLTAAGRRRTTGKVIAVWHDDRILLHTLDNTIVRVDLADRNPPKYGDLVEVVGTPETDLYRLNLSRGIWKKITTQVNNEKELDPTNVTVKMLTMTPSGERAFQTNYHGLPIRLVGTVVSLPIEAENTRLGLRSENQIIPVDASSCPVAFDDIEIGCTIAASGTCLMESANWHPNAPFPHIEHFSIIVRTPDDIKILSYPPWWTASRLFAVIGALLTLLSVIFIWNRMLKRIAERRGRELADEKVAHVTSDLKVYERTRLAVELHDSLSQNLTGVSLSIRAANRLSNSDLPGMRRSLDVASKALDSCRDELKNCLWDLRNQTLEETDINEAIRLTLAPHVGDTKLFIRFNVPRERFSDNTAHGILRIIRELASNSVRHGGASEIRIAGSIDKDKLLFSVSDNGCGFDPENHPGVADGHYGLQGIQDRIDGLEGEMSIRSSIGKGTKVTISIKTTAA